MINPTKIYKLSRVLNSTSEFEKLRLRIETIKQEIRLEESEFTNPSSTMGHNLSNAQLRQLEHSIVQKKTLSLGKYLKMLAVEKKLPPVNDDTFGIATINKSYWSKLINDTLPTFEKNKLIRISFFLKLSLKQVITLLNKAGFTLSEENSRDYVIIFFLENKLYDIVDLEEILLSMDMRSLFTNSR
ncbi:hypothetical protein DVB69_01280 [Sporosarcina sp. BI001-red]|nr:hypothetical protein DVB69_01280 [Sporosarcina sp. BI001-red]